MPKTPGLPLAEAIQFGWRTVREYPLFLVGTVLASIGVPCLISWGGDVAFDDGAQQFAIWLINLAASATLSLGLAKIYLRYRDGERPVFENLFDGLAHVHKFLGAHIIASVAVFMGLLLLIIPGIMFLIRLWFIGFVIVDTKVGPLEAIQQSWDISRGRTFDLFLLFLLLCGLNLLGLICLGVGVLITMPISGLALAHIYRVLKPAPATSVVDTA
jgi:uncharacterized membrane protein